MVLVDAGPVRQWTSSTDEGNFLTLIVDFLQVTHDGFGNLKGQGCCSHCEGLTVGSLAGSRLPIGSILHCSPECASLSVVQMFQHVLRRHRINSRLVFGFVG